MAVMYADGPKDIHVFKVANAEDIGPRELIYRSSNQYVGAAINNCYPCGVTISDPETPSADGGSQVTAYINPNTRFWCDIANGTGLSTDEGGRCDVYDKTGIDVDSSGAPVAYVWYVDTANQRALVSFRFEQHFEQTDLT